MICNGNIQMDCKQCGECCRYIVFGMAYGGADWNEYYYQHGCRIIPGVGLLVPSVCQHLKQKGSTNRYECDIYQTRPQLCRLQTKNQRFYKPETCTDPDGG